METVFYVFAKAVEIYLSLVSLAMLFRIILQFFASEDNVLLKICLILTEPFIMPVRYIMAKLNVAQGAPIDVPFFIAYLILAVLQTFLPVI